MKFFSRVIRLFFGLLLYALAITLTINANLGLAPWDVFHSGLSSFFGVTFGQANILVGLVLLVVDFFLDERIGWGSIANMFFIGFFIDIIQTLNFIPISQTFLSGFFMLTFGLMLCGFASYFYMSSGLGIGPRDGLMVAILKRTGKSVPLIGNSMEGIALVCGFFMGGSVGIGTIYVVFTIGYFLQFAYKICNFDVKALKHRYVDEDFKVLVALLNSK